MEPTPILDLPYFDLFFEGLKQSKAHPMQELVGENVHWGYWPDPKSSTGTSEDFRQAGQRLNAEILTHVPLRPGSRILDVGCGFGGTLRWILQRGQDLDLVGLNIDPRQVERARELTVTTGNNKIQYIVGNACKLPFADASFDALVAVECIFHFPSRADFFREASRVLKPGGVLALSDFMLRPWGLPLMGLLYPFYSRSLRRIYGGDVKSTIRSEYRRLARRNGLKMSVERDITANTLPTYPILRSNAKLAGDRAIDFYRANRYLDFVSRVGAYGYEILAFHK